MSRNSILSILMVLLLNFTLSGKTFIEPINKFSENNFSELASVVIDEKSYPPGNLLEFIDAPADITIDCSASYDFVPSLAANCDSVSDVMVNEIIVDATPDCPVVLIYQRVYTATDTCEHSISHTQLITVVDNTPPVIICPADVSVDCVEDLPDPLNIVITDNCAIDTIFSYEFVVSDDGAVADMCVLDDAVGLSPNYWAFWLPGLPLGLPDRYVFDPQQLGQFTRTGNTAHFTGTVHAIVGNVHDYNKVFDFDIMVKDRLNWDDWSALLTISPPFVNRSFKDAPENATDNLLHETWDYYVIDETLSMLTGQGEYAGTTFNLSHQPASLFYGFQVGLAANNKNAEFGMSAWFDYIGDLIYNGDTYAAGGFGDVNFEADCGPGTLPVCEANLLRKWTAVDACGNASTCEQLLHYEDSIPPVFDFCPPDLTLSCSDAYPDTVWATATDNCVGEITITVTDTLIGTGCNYVINRVFDALDACDNLTKKTQVFTFQDITPPVITCPDDVFLKCNADVPPADTSLVSASDDCAGIITIAHEGDVVISSGCLLIIERTYSATDECLNQSTCVQIISIPTDSVAPVLTCPGDVTLACNSPVPPADPGEVSKTDNCSSSQLVEHVGDVTIQQGCLLVIERTYSGPDNCGNIGFCSYTITIPTDLVPPIVVCPPDATLACNADAPAPNTQLVGGSDACGIDFFSFESDSESIVNCVKTVTRTYSATDFCGNTGFCTQTFTIPIDAEAPIITCPADVTLLCNSSAPVPDVSSVSATDNCGDPVIAHVGTALGGGPCIEIVIHTYSATDACGNESFCSQAITIPFDFDPPVVNCPTDATLACNADAPAFDLGLVTATDNCGLDFISHVSDTENIVGCVKTVTRIYSATDLCNNTGFCTQTFTIPWDSEPPVIVCPPDVTLACNAAIPDPDTGLVGATDNCPGLITIGFIGDNSVLVGCNLIVTRTYRASDACDNTADCIQTITIPTDVEAPVITCQPDVTLVCNEDGLPTPDVNSVIATDNCGTPIVTLVGDDIVQLDCSFLLVYTYRATDACGNFAECTQVYTVPSDFEPPLVTCPPNATLECNATVPTPDLGLVTATDNCGLDFISHVSDTENIVGCVKTVTRIYSATDLCNNTGFCTQTFTIPWDSEPPVIVCPPDVTLACNAAIPDPDTGLVGATDNCPGLITIGLIGDNSVLVGCNLIVTRTYRASDACGNTSDCIQTITIPTDTENPVITCPGDVLLKCNAELPPPDISVVTVTDNCPGAISVVWGGDVVVSPGSCLFIIERTYIATDACGNQSSCMYLISIPTDAQAPVLTCPGDVTLACNAPVPPANPGLVTKTDNCSSNQTVLHEGDSILQQGCVLVIQRTFSGADNCGNIGYCSYLITIPTDTEPPVIVCPADVTLPCNSPLPDPDTGLVTATDNCGVPTVTHVSDLPGGPGAGPCLAVIVRTYKAADDCGNETFCTQLITVPIDFETPILTCPADSTLPCNSAFPDPDPSLVTATDNCGIDSVYWVTDNLALGTCGSFIERVYAAVDLCGNVSTCTQIISVPQDSSPPLLVCPPDATLACNASVPAPDPGSVTVEDFCAQVTAVFDGDIESISGCTKTVLRTYSATDDCGNQGFCTQTFTIPWDSEAPVIVCPTDVTLSCNSPLPAPDTGSVSATDNCGVPTVTHVSDVTGGPGASACTTVIVRTYKATDDCGNESFCDQLITIPIDTEDPVLTCPADTLLPCNTLFPDPDPSLVSATDNCGIDSVYWVTDNLALGTCGSFIERVYAAVDLCGNVGTCTQVISVPLDSSPPLLICPPNATLACNASVPTPDPGSVSVEDFCATVTVVYDGDIESISGCTKTVLRTYSATDDCGNTGTCIQTFTIPWDSEPPVVVCPPDATLACNSAAPAPDTGLVTATDNCGVDFYSHVGDSEIIDGCIKTVTRTYSATDECGNEGFCTQTFTIPWDTEAPVITCPEDVFLKCNAELPLPDISLVTATDNCPGGISIAFVSDVTISSGSCVLIVERTYSATDVCGNQSTCSYLITIPTDSIPPVLTCPGDVTLECNSPVPPADPSEVTKTDNCSNSQLVNHVGDSVIFQGGCLTIILRTYSGADNCGNVGFCSQTITIPTDLVPPIVVCPPDATLACNAETPAPNTQLLGVSDACGNDFFSWEGDDESIVGCVKTLTRTYSATDLCGNEGFCTQTFTIPWDIEPPVVLNPPVDITVECGEGYPSYTPEWSDNCPGDIIEDAISAISSPGCTQYVSQVFYAIDACGNEASVSRSITIVDTQAPALQNPPVDVTIECGEPIPTYEPIWEDECDNDLLLTAIGGVALDSCAQYQFFTYTASDTCGNTSSVNWNITIVDTTPPELSIDCPLEDITISCGIAIDPVPGFAIDACDGEVPVELIIDFIPGNCPQEGTIIWTWSASDNCGNSTSCEQIIHVIDTVPPVITCPSDLTIEWGDPDQPPATGVATADDFCDPNPIVDFTDNVIITGNCPVARIIERTWTATDACGNQSTCLQVISVTDLTPPVIVCPLDLTIEWGDPEDPGATGQATASDNCDPNPTVTYTDNVIITGTCPIVRIIERIWVATDICGNTSTCLQIIYVTDLTPPVIVCPLDLTIEWGDPEDPSATGEATATDNCDPNPFIDWSDNVIITGTCPVVRIIERTWVAIDNCGNASTCLQVISVTDLTPPEILACTGDLVLPCNSPVPSPQPSSVIAIDNCDLDLTITSNDTTLSEGCLLVIERTYYVTDDCGNQSTCSHLITIPTDSEPPVVSNPPVDLTIECTESYPPYIPEWTDNCPGDIVEDAISAISSPGCAQYVSEVFSATDACGNTTSVSRSITILDTQAPVLQNPPVDVTVECGDPIPTYEPIWIDECDNGLLLSAIGGTGMDGCNEIQFFTYTAVDTCGNSSSVDWNITIIDTTPPDILACTGDYTLPCNSPLPPAETSSVIATDNCDLDLTITSNDTTLSEGCLLVIERTYYVTDDCGNQSTCSHLITIPTDTELPVVTCPEDLTLACNSNIPPVDEGSVTATDNCPGALAIDHVEDDLVYLECMLIVTRTYSATDECGNIGYCFQSISIPQDNQAPSITCPADVTLACNSDLPGADINEVTASDNCPSGVNVVHEGDVTLAEGCLLVVLRTYSATDACGNQSSCSYTISIPTDTDVPFITCPADLIDLPCNSDIPPVDLGSVTAFDQCGTPVVTHDGDDTFMDGCDQITNRTYRATDDCGNFNTCVQQIVIRIDTDAPELQTVIADTTISCMDPIPAPPVVVFTDNCGDPAVTYGEETTNFDCGSEIVRTWTATDECGNTTTATQTLTVTDDVPPVIVPPSQLSDIKTCEEINIDLIIEYIDGTISEADSISLFQELSDLFEACDLVPTATDACSDSWIVKTEFEIFGFKTIKFPNVGHIICHFIAVDACGNVSGELETTIIIDDAIFPTVDCQDITVTLGEDGYYILDPSELDGGSSDNCGPVFLTTLISDFDCDDVGSHTVMLFATDLGGNLTFCSANVNVQENGQSGINCPGDLTVGTTNNQLCISTVDGLIATPKNACEELVITNDSPYAYNSGPDASGVYPAGVHIITWTGDDGNGLIVTCSTELTVVDQTDPNALCKNIAVTLNNDEVTIPAFAINNGSFDNCDGNDMTYLIDDQPSIDFGCETANTVQTVTLTVIDAAGNSSTCVAQISIQDNSTPVISCPDDVIVEMGDCGVADVNLASIIVTDNCLVSVTNDSPYANGGGADVSGTYPIGTTVVTVTAIDAANNSASCSFSITVLGYPAPENLESQFFGDAYVLSWDPVPGSVVCQIKGGPQGGGDNASLIIWGDEPASKYVPLAGGLQLGQSYQWKVRCACSTDPLVVSEFSDYDYFTVPLNPGTDLIPPGEVVEKSTEVKGVSVSVYPNPNRGEFYVETDLKQYNIKVMDITGKEVLSIGEINTQLYLIELDDVERGIYFVRVMNSDFQEVIKVVID